MKLGPFYFDTKELFLFLAAFLITLSMYFDWPLYWFSKEQLLTLVILFLLLKGLLPSVHNEAFLLLAVSAVFLTLYLPFFQVIVFFFLGLFVFKLLKVI